MTVEVHGLVCPQCGERLDPAGVTYVRVTVPIDDVLRFDVEGLAKHRCGASLRKRLAEMDSDDG